MVLNKEKTDKILNSYEGMSPSSVWSAWNSVQKSHFLRDHFHTKGEVVPVNVYKLSFNELPESLKREISTHVYSGQYAKGGVVKGAKFKHDGKEYEIKKIQDGSIYTTDGKIYSLKALESFGVKFTKERAKSNKPRGVRGERRERIEYELEDLYNDLKYAKQDLRDLKRDMEEEAGEKGEKWTDEDANRYGEQMNFIEAQIESLEKQIAVKEEKLSYEKGGKVEDKVYIDFLNKEKGFKKDRKYFKSYEEARKWALKNFDKFDPDMIKTEMAKGGSIESYSTSDLMGVTGITKEEMDKFGMGREDLLSLAKEQGQTRKSNNWEYSIGGL
jgi:hypothetical protein